VVVPADDEIIPSQMQVNDACDDEEEAAAALEDERRKRIRERRLPLMEQEEDLLPLEPEDDDDDVVVGGLGAAESEYETETVPVAPPVAVGFVPKSQRNNERLQGG